MRHEFVVSDTNVRAFWEPARLRFTTRGPTWLRPWLERAVRALLRWSRAEIERTEKVRTFRPASGETLLERMRLNEQDLMMLYDQRARYVFIGPDIHHELLDVWRMMSLGPLDVHLGGPRGIKTVMGVEVVFVPWMNGALLVPEWRDGVR